MGDLRRQSYFPALRPENEGLALEVCLSALDIADAADVECFGALLTCCSSWCALLYRSTPYGTILLETTSTATAVWVLQQRIPCVVAVLIPCGVGLLRNAVIRKGVQRAHGRKILITCTLLVLLL